MTVYRVQWIRIWRRLAAYAFAVIPTSVVGIQTVRLIRQNYRTAFWQLSPLENGCLVIGATLIGCLMMGLAAFLMTFYRVRINNDVIVGRSYWLLKRQFRPQDVVSLEPFKEGLVTGFMVKSKFQGKMFFPSQIERLEELKTRLTSHLTD